MGRADRLLGQLTPSYADDDIAVYRIGGASPAAPQDKRALAIAAHLVWTALLIGSGAVLAASGIHRQSSGPRPWRRS
jgi:hypothetical protein